MVVVEFLGRLHPTSSSFPVVCFIIIMLLYHSIVIVIFITHTILSRVKRTIGPGKAPLDARRRLREIPFQESEEEVQMIDRDLHSFGNGPGK